MELACGYCEEVRREVFCYGISCSDFMDYVNYYSWINEEVRVCSVGGWVDGWLCVCVGVYLTFSLSPSLSFYLDLREKHKRKRRRVRMNGRLCLERKLTQVWRKEARKAGGEVKLSDILHWVFYCCTCWCVQVNLHATRNTCAS